MKLPFGRYKLLLSILVAAGIVAVIVAYESLAGGGGSGSGSITFYAACSTTDAVNQIAREYEKKTGVKVRVSFASSSTLALQIEAGAPVDVYISADEKWMDYLAARKLIDPASRVNLLGNRLVVVVPKSSNLAIKMDKSFDLPAAFKGRLSIAEPTNVPAGRYARQALEYMGWWDALKNRLAPGQDVRAALRFVEMDEAPIGVVYATDAVISDKVKVAAVFPPDSHKPITFPVAICHGARPGAKKFLAFLQSAEARKAFEKYGFQFLAHPAPTVKPKAAGAFDSEAEQAVWLSLKVAFWCMLAVAIPGVALGWILARKQFFGKAVLDALVHAPLVMPPVVVGYLALILLGQRGPLGRVLEKYLGVHLAFTWQGAVVVSAIMGLPLIVRSVRLAMDLVDRKLEAAASVLGAGPVRVFVTVTLPLAMPGILAGLVLAFARSLGEFGATITFVGNIVGETQTLPLAIFSRTQSPGGDTQALWLASISLVLALGTMAIAEVLTRKAAKRVRGA